ncbi:MAG: hypothetical protein HY825_01975 [Acidobacteria bacterium]|nr:hypothetical protein [Acidobacteriota bacterium]
MIPSCTRHEGRRGHGWRGRAIGLAASLAVAAAAGAGSPDAVCNLGTTAFFDQSSRCVGAGRIGGCETSRIYRLKPWRFGDRQFLFVSTWTSLNLYDVTSPVSAPTVRFILPANQPWGLAPPTSDWDELQFDAAVADDYDYGIAMFQHYGWVSFRINNPTAPTGLTVKKAVRFTNPDTASRPKFARLFKGVNGQWYAVGSYLDGTSSAVSIVAMGADASNPHLVKSFTSSQAAYGDALETAEIGGRWWLFVKRSSGTAGVAIFDVASAAGAREVAFFPGLSSDFYVDRDSARLYVLAATSPRTIKVVDIADPAAPIVRSTITLLAGTYSWVAGNGKVVVAAKGRPGLDPDPNMQAFSVVDPDAPVEVATGELNLSAHPDELLADLAVLGASDGNARIYRAAYSVGTVTTISAACFPDTPRPALAVANQSAVNAAAADCGAADADGFPGDSFDLHDATTGQVAGGTVTITNEAAQTVFGPVAWSAGATWTWPSTTGHAPGLYTATMTLLDQAGAPYGLTRTIRLCCDATAAISGPTETCAGSPVTLDAGDGFAAYLWSPDGETTSSITVVPGATTSYSVAVTSATGCTTASAAHTVTVVAPPAPAAPVMTVPARVHSGETFEVAWTATGSSGSYELQEAEDPRFAGAMTFAMNGTTAAFSHSAMARTVFYYRVRAMDSCGTGTYPSPWSGIAQVLALPKGTATPGIYRGSDRSWYLRNTNDAGGADQVFTYGEPSDLAVRGDWDGDGVDSVGVYRGGTFYLRNANSAGAGDVVFAFGGPGDVPISGDWDGDGIDTVGLYRPRTATWLLRNSNSAGAPDLLFTYGLADETPVVGDWDGDGIDTVGVFRASDRQWYLHNSTAGGHAELVFPYGDPSVDVPVVGDWDGNGVDTVGIYRSSLGEWFLRNTNTAGDADISFTYGLASERPIAGDWDGF